MKKAYNHDNFGGKSLLLSMKQFLFKIQNYAMEWHHQWFFKLAYVTSVKTACVCIYIFIQYFRYYGHNIFSITTVLYLIAKVERK